MDEERRRLLLEKGRQSLQKHRENKGKTSENASVVSSSHPQTPATPTTAPNGLNFSSPASPTQFVPIPASNFSHEVPVAAYQLPTTTLDAQTAPVNALPVSMIIRQQELEAQLATVQAALSASQHESGLLKSETSSLKASLAQYQINEAEYKHKNEELLQSAARNLQTREAALKDAHATDLAQIKLQLSQVSTDAADTIDQLKRDKAEMQGMIHLLQQQVSSASSTSSSEHVLRKDEQEGAAILRAQISDLQTALNLARSAESEKLDSLRIAHQSTLNDLKAQHEHQIATMMLDHSSEVQQLRSKAQEATEKMAMFPADAPASQSQSAELSDLQNQLTQHKETISEKDSSIAKLEDELAEKRRFVADLESKLKQASDLATTMQTQTSSNVAQVEQMRQQLLRDRMDLSKKLSLIAPETIRRVEQLQRERDLISAQFAELTMNLSEMAQQKSDLLEKLAVEVSRNAALVHQNSQLRQELMLQLHAISGNENSLKPILPPPSSIQPEELPTHFDATVASSSENGSDLANGTSSQDQIELVQWTEGPKPTQVSASPQLGPSKSPQPASGNLAKHTTSKSSTLRISSAPGTAQKSAKKHSKLGPKPPHQRHGSSNDTHTRESDSHTHRENIPRKETPDSMPEEAEVGDPNQKKASGWLSSVPLVGRLWQGQPQIRHSAQVDL